jgi:hypothetical protein
MRAERRTGATFLAAFLAFVTFFFASATFFFAFLTAVVFFLAERRADLRPAGVLAFLVLDLAFFSAFFALVTAFLADARSSRAFFRRLRQAVRLFSAPLGTRFGSLPV